MSFLGWFVCWRVVSCLACVVASRAGMAWRAGEGGGLILPALAKSAPTLPSPPRHPGTARCAACGSPDRNAGCLSLSRVIPNSGAGAHGIARARGEPFRQSLLAVCGGRLTPCPGAERSNVTPNRQSEATSARTGRARQRRPESAEPGNVSPNQQSEAASPRTCRAQQRHPTNVSAAHQPIGTFAGAQTHQAGGPTVAGHERHSHENQIFLPGYLCCTGADTALHRRTCQRSDAPARNTWLRPWQPALPGWPDRARAKWARQCGRQRRQQWLAQWRTRYGPQQQWPHGSPAHACTDAHAPAWRHDRAPGLA